ncbi:MAG: DUF6503 family protein [Chitinophagaceae bacterium]
MTNKFCLFSAIVLLITVTVSCNQDIKDGSNLPVTMDDSSRAIIDRAIAYAGGYEPWQQKKTLSFDKKSISYDSAGNIVRKIDQHFDYMMKPEYRAKITYIQNDTAITLIHDGQQARKLYNGKVSTEQKDIDAAWNSGYGSHFVFNMPFKLKDPGMKAEYIGEMTLNNGTQAQVVKTSYIKGAGSNPDHIWYYYFEPASGKLLANSLTWGTGKWDYTRYETFENASGLQMPGVRKGYTADTLNKPGRQVSESRHFNIVFDKEFPEDHFKIKNAK